MNFRTDATMQTNKHFITSLHSFSSIRELQINAANIKMASLESTKYNKGLCMTKTNEFIFLHTLHYYFSHSSLITHNPSHIFYISWLTIIAHIIISCITHIIIYYSYNTPLIIPAPVLGILRLYRQTKNHFTLFP